MTSAQHIYTGLGAPDQAPQHVAAHYIDEATGDQYIAAGTASAADWRLVAQVSNGALEAHEPGTHQIGQSTRTVDIDLTQGSQVLELDDSLLRGAFSVELWIHCDSESPADLYIGGAASGPGAELGYSNVDALTVYGQPSASGYRWQLASFGASVSFVWVRLQVIDGVLHLDQRLAE